MNTMVGRDSQPDLVEMRRRSTPGSSMDREHEPTRPETQSSGEHEYKEFDSQTINGNPKIVVKELAFEGLDRTDRAFVEAVLKPCLTVTSLYELSDSLNAAFQRLERLNVFKDVSVVIDRAEDSDDDLHEIKLLFRCKEKRFNIRTGTELRRRDIVWNFGGVFFNVFGRAEILDINTSVGANSSMPFNVNFSKPLSSDSSRTFVLNVANFRENFLNNCKWRQESRSLSAAYQIQPDGPNAGRHEFKYVTEWRHLFDVQSGASHVIRDQAGHSLKSSLIHSWTRSTRDDSMLPTRGHLARLVSEFAGLGGDSTFLKSETVLQGSWTPTLTRLFTLTGTLKLGHIVPLAETRRILLADRLQMGGPTSIRGFALNSLGPRQFSDALGGTSLAEGGLQVSFPFLQSASHFARAHMFVNAGVLGELDVSKMAGDVAHAMRTRSLKDVNRTAWLDKLHPNVSIGGGFMFKMAESARLELNLVLPILTQHGVESSRGVQVGIGMEFL